MDGLTKTWLWLMGLVVATVALSQIGGPVGAALLLVLAALKSRAILGGFLHLSAAPGWLSAVMLPLSIWLAMIWGLGLL